MTTTHENAAALRTIDYDIAYIELGVTYLHEHIAKLEAEAQALLAQLTLCRGECSD